MLLSESCSGGRAIESELQGLPAPLDLQLSPQAFGFYSAASLHIELPSPFFRFAGLIRPSLCAFAPNRRSFASPHVRSVTQRSLKVERWRKRSHVSVHAPPGALSHVISTTLLSVFCLWRMNRARPAAPGSLALPGCLSCTPAPPPLRQVAWGDRRRVVTSRRSVVIYTS